MKGREKAKKEKKYKRVARDFEERESKRSTEIESVMKRERKENRTDSESVCSIHSAARFGLFSFITFQFSLYIDSKPI